jgi:hypothetical protein
MKRGASVNHSVSAVAYVLGEGVRTRKWEKEDECNWGMKSKWMKQGWILNSLKVSKMIEGMSEMGGRRGNDL